MSSETHKQFYWRYIACCNAHDLGNIGKFVGEELKVNGQTIDLTTYKARLADIFSAFPDHHWHLNILLAEGDWLAAQFINTGTHQGEFRGVAATQRPIRTLEFAFYRIEESKIKEIWDEADNLTMLEQLGVFLT